MLQSLNGIVDYHLPTNHIDKQQTVYARNDNGMTYLTLHCPSLCPIPFSSCKERADSLQMCMGITQ
jgi:hypothetical protein